MSFSIAIDIGGTFTDCIVEDGQGQLHIFKASSTPPDFETGFMNALKLAAEAFGLGLGAFLGQTRRIVHGSTVSTNALVERKAARTGFLCNAGHPDILTLREAVRKPVFNWRLDYPDPYVLPADTAEIRGRISARGDIIEPLNEADVRDAALRLKAQGVEAIGICFLWSVVDGAHERRAREIVHEIWPQVPVTLSHELNPVGREYRRAISTVIDASLLPIVSDYVTRLTRALDEAGFRDELLLANCIGGMMPPGDLIARPIFSVMSGPTLAPVAAQRLTSEPNVIVVDMGGTTFDVSAIRDGHFIVSQEAMIGDDMLGIPKIDVRSVGAGGGSIAAVDGGGMLHVGPHSAGARPGPACYGRGGERPTVTDANVVLGILDPDYFLGGRMNLDRAAAARVIGEIATGLGVSPEEAAYAIYTTSNNVMVGAIEDMTVKEGIDPRDSFMVVGGGATAAHICEIAQELGIARLMVPRFAAGLSAYGGLISDIRWEEQATALTSSVAFDPARVNAVIGRLVGRGRAFLTEAGVPAERQRFATVFLGRYQYQSWEIEVPFDLPQQGLGGGDLAGLTAAFHAMHERIYSVKAETDVVEFTTWKVRAIGLAPERPARAIRPAGHGAPVPKAHRRVYVREAGGIIDCPVYGGVALGAGTRLSGPAVIEEPTTTIMLLPRWTAMADSDGNYLLELH